MSSSDALGSPPVSTEPRDVARATVIGRGWTLRLIVLCSSLLVALATGEVLTRLLSPIVLPAPNPDLEFDPALGWTQRSGTTSVHVNEDGSAVSVRGGMFGIRQPTSDYLMAGGVNMLVLGDSFTAGTQIPFDETWPARLGRRLTARTGRVQVVNAGIDGYDLGQEYWLAERLWPRFKPSHLVVALYVGNDVIDYDRDSVTSPPWCGPSMRGWLRQHSYLYHVVSRAKQSRQQRNAAPTSSRWAKAPPGGDWAPWSVRGFARLADGQRQQIRRQFAAPELVPVLSDDEAARHKVRATERVLESLASLAASRSARFTVVVLPFKLQVIPAQRQEWARLHDLSAEQVFLPQNQLRIWAAQKGIHLVDVSEAFLREAEPEKLFWPVDLHYSSAGHAAVAEMLALALESHGAPRP